MKLFEIDPDIKKALTLVSEFYTNEKYFELSKEKIFARSWQFLCTSDEVNNLKPVNILEGFLDEPVLLSKDGGKIYCLSNVCTHRGKIVIENSCEGKLLRCGYHGRRFALNGKFLSMPEFNGVENFPGKSDDLYNISLAARAGFLFASIDPIAPFENFVNDAALKLDDVDPDNLRLVSTREYIVNAHWALYCENYLEGFHIPFVHKSLNEVVDFGSYTTETFRYSSLQTALSGPPALAGGSTSPSEAINPSASQVQQPANAGCSDKIAARYLFIFPNLMFNFYPWGISVNIVKPIHPARSKIEFRSYVSEESKLNTGAGGDLHRVELEDEAVVESVQKGIRSRFYSQGRYSPTREQGIHHFHRLIAEFMG